MEIETFAYTPQELKKRNHFFNIPIYQRLYAWEEKQISKLLEDLYSSFRDKPNSDYYIGNWVIYQKQENERYDIIDGQQRMTTLWLMGFVLKQYHHEWIDFISENNRKLRLDFVARDGDNKFLKSLLEQQESDVNKLIEVVKSQSNTSENINPVMIGALKYIFEFMSNIELDKRNGFSEFIFNHTKFVGILLPNGTDLNKYFEVMNNRGVQLEKHEILKALLLAKIKDDNQRKLYAKVWDACANMNVYIESFVNDKPYIATFTNNEIVNDNVYKIFQAHDNDNTHNLLECLKKLDESGAKNTSEKPKQNETNTIDVEKCTSIVNFPMFLLHILRLYNNDVSIKIEDKDLIDIFQRHYFDNMKDNEDENKAVDLLNKLLYYRILFDKYVIKSISKDNDYFWQIRELKQESNDNYIRSSKSENKPLEMVEAFLQISTQQDIWLSLLLKKVSAEKVTEENLVEYLELIDCLLSKERLGDNNQKSMFEKLFNNEYVENNDITTDWKFLDKGTSTPRYWFFKLDYLVWKDEKIKIEKRNFQFRQNRSVEHVHAQSQNNEINNEWDRGNIDSFGNLALISVSSNAQNNDNGFDVKKAYFKQRSEKYGFESLKLAVIFEYDSWTKEKCAEHREDMIKILNAHYKIGSQS